ncbi:MAG: Ig-like domain-containing protein, partial [Hyphomicrobiales bacterium]|nr:Ig-like domain-containing protein [Hyphomicrobiales bacterium]
MTAIQSGTMADVVTAFDPETYFSYDLHFDLVCSADDSKVILQFSSDGGETWHTSDHKWTWVKCDNTYPASGTPEGLGSNGYGGTDGLYLGRIGNGSGEGMQGRVTLVRPELSTRRRANWEAASSLTNGGGQNERMYVGSGAYTPANSPINAARFVAESGSLTGSWNLSGAEIGTPVGAQEDEQPVATNDTDVATQNTAKPISAAFLLANDTGGNLSLISVGNALNCTVSIVGGDVSFTPVTDFIGTATFDYTISNTVGSAVGTVTVTVSEASIWTNLTGADFANGDTGSFSWSGSTITASANDKNVRTSAGFI